MRRGRRDESIKRVRCGQKAAGGGTLVASTEIETLIGQAAHGLDSGEARTSWPRVRPPCVPANAG